MTTSKIWSSGVRSIGCLLFLALALSGLVATVANAQTDDNDGLWRPATTAERAARGALVPWIQPPVALDFLLDLSRARAIFSRTPLEGPAAMPARIRLPRPDGRLITFLLVEAPVMAPGLAEQFPDIRTYVGQGVEDPHAAARIGWSPAGFYAQVLTPEGAWYVEPRHRGDNQLHASYFRRDYRRADNDFSCLTTMGVGGVVTASRDLLRSGPTLRTYRAAVAATGEYTAFHGGTVAAGMNAIVQAMNRVNGIYEREVGVRMVLVASNSVLVFTNGVTDPYSNLNGFAMLGENQTVVDARIGSANYDIGHVFSTGGGGVAALGSVCVNGVKARGVTGLPAPTGDAFYVDYVAHEMGHQFAGNHTFNSTLGSCGGGNRNASTAYEPGSGSTIQAYAGICAADDLQPNSDPYFHSVSFDEIIAFINGTGGSCAVATATSNTAPTVSAGPAFTIPAGTPFRLTATGSDPDGDPLTYCWEQRDLGPALALTAADNGSSPLFRSFNPTISPTRVFPRLTNIVSGVPSLGERLPTTSRTMRFRVTARDNRAGGGGVNTADTSLTVVSNAGPFVVIAPAADTNFIGSKTVTWNVANTTNAPINAATVNIRLSVDGGQTFPILLATNTPNDGSEVVTVPSVPTTRGRVMVEAASNVFFNISSNNLTVPFVGAGANLAVTGAGPTPALVGTPFNYDITVANLGPDLAVPVVVTNQLPASALILGVSNTSGTVTQNGSELVVDFGVMAGGQSATYSVTLVVTNPMTLTNMVFVSAATVDLNPANNSITMITSVLNPLPTLSAGAAALAGESFLPPNGAIEAGETVTMELSVVASGFGTTTNLIGTLLPGGGVTNAGATGHFGVVGASSGPVSRSFAFTVEPTAGSNITVSLQLQDGVRLIGVVQYVLPVGQMREATNSAAIIIPDAGAASPYPSQITVAGLAGQVAGVTVTLHKFNHSFPDDVDVLLVGPSGQKAMLMSDAGAGIGVSNLFLTFDDTAGAALPDLTALTSGTFKPTDHEAGENLPAPAPAGPSPATLSAFNGAAPNGTWSLFVADDSGGDAGNIAAGWSLKIKTITQLNAPGDVALSMSASTNAAVAGFPFTYRITASNVGTNVARGVTVTDVLPDSLSVVSVVPSQGMATNFGNIVSGSLGSLAPGGSATLNITAIPVTVGSVTNVATVAISQTETASANNTATAIITVNPPAPLLVTAGSYLIEESFNPRNGSVDAGETVTLDLALANVGTADTANLVVTLLAANGVQAPGPAQNYGALSVGGPAVSRTFSFTAAPGATAITAVLQLQDGSTDLGTVSYALDVGRVTRWSSAGAITIPQIGSASPYPATITVTNLSGLITKVSVTLSNFTHGFPQDVDVLLVGPDGQRVMLMSDTGGLSSVAGLDLTFEDTAGGWLPNAAPLSSGTYRPTNLESDDAFAPPAPGGPYSEALAVFNGTAPAGVWSLFISDDTNGDGGSVVDGWSLELTTVSPVNPTSDLGLAVAVSTNTAITGTNVIFVATVTNRGPSTANTVVLTNTLPAPAALVFISAGQGSVFNVSGQLIWNVGTLSNGASAALTFIVSPQSAGTVTNLAGVYSGEADFLPADNTASTVLSVFAAGAPVLGSTAPQTNGVFQFAINGQDGVPYVIEASTNLIDWVPIATNFTSGGRYTITDGDALLIPYRFYRARQLVP